ncbi:MAG: hypothetical protein E6R08_00240 [Nevskiaceae bacterium]|nr:MAG: hypothetical protein E6R08_00240 [Nevskiaceae bacterium]
MSKKEVRIADLLEFQHVLIRCADDLNQWRAKRDDIAEHERVGRSLVWVSQQMTKVSGHLARVAEAPSDELDLEDDHEVGLRLRHLRELYFRQGRFGNDFDGDLTRAHPFYRSFHDEAEKLQLIFGPKPKPKSEHGGLIEGLPLSRSFPESDA